MELLHKKKLKIMNEKLLMNSVSFDMLGMLHTEY